MGGNVKLRLNSEGIRQALSSPAVKMATLEAAERIADQANSMYESRTFEYHSPSSGAAYMANEGKNARLGIANVATASYVGALDNSRHHTLQKAGGV
jgi:hypothetical protein